MNKPQPETSLVGGSCFGWESIHVVPDALYMVGFVFCMASMTSRGPSVLGDVPRLHDKTVIFIWRIDRKWWAEMDPIFQIRTCFGVSDGFPVRMMCRQSRLSVRMCFPYDHGYNPMGNRSWTVRDWRTKHRGCHAVCWVYLHYFTSA